MYLCLYVCMYAYSMYVFVSAFEINRNAIPSKILGKQKISEWYLGHRERTFSLILKFIKSAKNSKRQRQKREQNENEISM